LMMQSVATLMTSLVTRTHYRMEYMLVTLLSEQQIYLDILSSNLCLQ